MNSPGLPWTIFVPLMAGALGTLLMAGRRRQRLADDYGPWLRLGALLAVCAGLLLEAIFLAFTPDAASVTLLGMVFSTSAPARYVLTAANVSLLCAALYYWTMPGPVEEEAEALRRRTWVPVALGGASTLLTCVGLAADRLMSTLLLLGAAMLVAMLALPMLRPGPIGGRNQSGSYVDDEEVAAEAQIEARGYAGALKHVALAVIATSLWVVGATLVERYGFNLENRGLLQFGIGLLAAGLVVWAGSMPFAASWGDLIDGAPTAAIVALGACAPVALLAGMLALAPVEGSLARGAAAGWVGAMGALLAGLRALGAMPRPARDARKEQGSTKIASLKGMTVAVAVSWAVYGVLSSSQTGAVGAMLVATNVALAVPLLLVGRRWAVVVGVVSMLGLPPFGGFAGAVLVAQSAANAGGLWLALLLAGSGLVGGAWLANRGQEWASPAIIEDGDRGWKERLTDPIVLLTVVLAAAQVGLFLVGSWRLAPLLSWATVPWLSGP
jgi:hypothetical protein